MVVVDGRVLIECGTHTGRDEDAITTAGSAAIQKIWDLPEARKVFES